MTKKTAVLTLCYLLTIPLGVLAISKLGVVPIPGGYMAPAAVYVVGVTLVLRDLVHRAAGWKVAAAAVVVGAALSTVFNPHLALASGVAFLVAETLDLLVFEQVRRRFDYSPVGVLISNAVSIPVDSVIFLLLAFGSLQFFPGQVIGKSIATVCAVLVLAAMAFRERKSPSPA